MKRTYLVLAFLLSLQLACSSSAKKSAPAASPEYQGLGRESVDEKTLSQFAPPALDSELSRKIQNYLDVRSPGMGMLSPDKKRLFFTWRVTGTTQVWRLDQPKGFPIQMTGGEDNTSVVGQTQDGKWIVLSRDRNGEENPGLYLQPSQGGPLKLIQHKPKIQTHLQFVSGDSKFLVYRANDVKPDSYAFYRYDLETGKSELLLAQDGYWYISDYTDDGRILFTKAVTNTAREVFDYNLKTKEMKPVIGQNEKMEYGVQYAAKEGEYLVLTPKFGEFRRLYHYDGKDLKAVSPEIKWDVSGYEIDHKRTRLVYAVNENGYTRSHALDARTYKPLDFPKFPEADHVYLGQMTLDGSHVMVGVETSKGPRTSYSYNFKTKMLTQWVIPSQPEVDLSKFAKATLEYYPARDGAKIPMFVRRPSQCVKSATACPVVVHFHGGPEGQSMAGFHILAQMFVDEGIIFVEPNVRGSDGYGKTWFHADDAAKRLNVISDIEDAALYIKKEWAVNGQAPKVGVMGWSYGGYSTLLAMTKYAGSYDAGVALVGMSNLLTFLNNTAPYRRALRTPEYGDPVADKEALIKLSPSSYLAQLKSPLMIIQGVNDPRVPVGEAVQIQNALKARQVESSLILFVDEGHGTSKRSNKVLELGHTLNFLKKNLR